MPTSQRVSVSQHSDLNGRTVYEGTGTVAGFVGSSCSDGIAVAMDYRIVVACDDGRFRFCAPVDVRIIPAAALAEAA